MRVRVRVQQFFKFENPTLLQTPAIIIDPTVICSCFYLKNDRTDFCYCRNLKVTPAPVFPKYLTPGPAPGPKEKRRILLSPLQLSESGPTTDVDNTNWRAGGLGGLVLKKWRFSQS